jgi:dTDP-4-dehydrorhamnose reductase
MRVTLIGVGGMLNRAFEQSLSREGTVFRNLTIADLDLTLAGTIAGGLGDDPGVVINCAAYTDVDGAELNQELATAINGTGVGALAQACLERGALLVHFSTDYVFDGRASEPYKPETPRSPVSAYGKSKALGEQLIEESGCEHLMVRTSWLYAPWGKNFVKTITAAARRKPELRVVNDQRGRPTSAEGLADTTLKLLRHNARGVYHATDEGECTWYEFACEIVRLAGCEAKVSPCSSAEYPLPARRPAYSVLDLQKTEALLGPLEDWGGALKKVIGRLEY